MLGIVEHYTETQKGRLQLYSSLLLKWNKKINLIASSTENDFWKRHILDSAQLLAYMPKDKDIILTDIGSGAGLPGMVLAILGIKNVHLIESDIKKVAFLHETARITETDVHIHHARAEELNPWINDIVTARAFAPLDKTLNIITPFMDDKTLAILHKGKLAMEEVKTARKNWIFKMESSPSITDKDSSILTPKEPRRIV